MFSLIFFVAACTETWARANGIDVPRMKGSHLATPKEGSKPYKEYQTDLFYEGASGYSVQFKFGYDR